MSIYAHYNFVPLSAWIFKPDWATQVSHDLPFSDGICGSLELEIKAHTPILVGGKQRPATAQRPGEVHFFQLPDQTYAIPGTSLKGMIRNVLEMATFGKMRLVDDQWLSVRDLTKGGEFYRQHLSKNLAHEQNTYRPLARAGWLKLGATNKGELEWRLIPCEYARVEQEHLINWGNTQNIHRPERIKRKQSAVDKYRFWQNRHLTFDLEGKKRWAHQRGRITLEYNKARQSLGIGQYEGELVFTGQPTENNGQPGRKHMEFIFYKDSATPKKVDEKVIRGFQHIHADSEEWQYWYEKVRKGEKVPVFYLENGGKIDSLGLAMMYRLPYKNSIGATISHTNPEHLSDDFFDLPELIFGTVNDEKTQSSLKSRVSFSMAPLLNQIRPVLVGPTILGSPKASYYPNYVQQKNAQSYMTYMDNTAEIQGWKCYPVNPRWQVPAPDRDQQNNNKIQVKLFPLNEGARFKCFLDVHNLRPAELGALVWALTWGDDAKLRHGLGMGKPFGLGQISIKIKNEQLRSTDPQAPVPDSETCRQAFLELMEKVWQQAPKTGPKKNLAVKWAETVQLRQLLAMANPQNAPGQVDKLAYMPLRQFMTEKNTHESLPAYVNSSAPSDQELFRRLTALEHQQKAEKARREAEEVEQAKEMEQSLAAFDSDLKKDLHKDLVIGLKSNQDLAEKKATDWVKKMKEREADEAKYIAGKLQEFYTEIGKWKKQKPKSKQGIKIEAIKQVLDIT